MYVLLSPSPRMNVNVYHIVRRCYRADNASLSVTATSDLNLVNGITTGLSK